MPGVIASTNGIILGRAQNASAASTAADSIDFSNGDWTDSL